MTVKHLPIIVGILACLTATAQESGKIEYADEHIQWADSVLNTLTIRQKVAQLIMMAVYSNKTESYNQQTIELFDSLQFGGIIFMQAVL